MIIAFMIIGFGLGLFLGGCIRDYSWASNAEVPMRMCYRGKFYKVTEEQTK